MKLNSTYFIIGLYSQGESLLIFFVDRPEARIQINGKGFFL